MSGELLMVDGGFWGWIWAAVAVALGVASGLVARWILFHTLRRVSRRTPGHADDVMLPAARGPALLILPTFGVQFAMTLAPAPAGIAEPLHRILSIVLIVGLCWLAISILSATGQWLANRAAASEQSPLAIRSFKTRVHLLTRVVSGVVIVIASAIVLLSIPSVRQLGASILASAGIAGVVAGFAAQSILANMLAGLQLALTEPIRMGDVVVIDKESGTVEEINSTFVVVRLCDLRRLIVPLKYFLENRFENWTLRSTELLGVVTLFVGRDVSIQALRGEMERILSHSAHWDGKTGKLQATDMTEQSIQIKVMVSAANPDELSKLRSEVRESMLTHLQKKRAEVAVGAK